MDSVDKRTHFFDRQFLRATDFQAEQAYHLDRRRRHNTGFHSHGVVEGLRVVPSEVDNHVTIEPGWAVDPLGREMVLVTSRNDVPTGGANVNIWMAYPDPEPLSNSSTDPGVTGNTRVHEVPVLRVVPPDPIPAHGILLATVSAEGVINNNVRPLAGLKDGAVTSPKIADNSIQMGNLHPELRNIIESGATGNDAILSAMIAEADGTSGQKTGTGKGVKTDHLQDNAVTAAKLQSHDTDNAQRAVGATHLQNNSVTNEKVADNTLSYTKLRGVDKFVGVTTVPGGQALSVALGDAGFYFVSVVVASQVDATVDWHFSTTKKRFGSRFTQTQSIVVENKQDSDLEVNIRVYELAESS